MCASRPFSAGCVGALAGAALALVSLLGGCATRAVPPDLVGTMPHPRGEIRLFESRCEGGAGQLALQLEAPQPRQGCWQATPAGNVLLRWDDGARQVLDGNRVKLAPHLAARLPEPEAPAPPPRRRKPATP